MGGEAGNRKVRGKSVCPEGGEKQNRFSSFSSPIPARCPVTHYPGATLFPRSWHHPVCLYFCLFLSTNVLHPTLGNFLCLFFFFISLSARQSVCLCGLGNPDLLYICLSVCLPLVLENNSFYVFVHYSFIERPRQPFLYSSVVQSLCFLRFLQFSSVLLHLSLYHFVFMFLQPLSVLYFCLFFLSVSVHHHQIKPVFINISVCNLS